MANITCPQCGELNEENAIHCAACGARLDEPAKPRPAPGGTLLKENIPNILWLAAGVVFLFLGITVPWLGSAIIQLVLSFTATNSRASRSIGTAQPSNADAWLVLAIAVLCFLVGGFGLYQSLSKYWAKRLDKSESQE
jgi:zinc-ribbon domain